MTDALGVDPDHVLLEGRYELGAALGAGSTGTVFRAHDHLLARTVAVKLLAAGPDGADPDDGPVQELSALASVHHPGLVTLLDAGADEGRTFLVMELVEGDALDRVVVGHPLDTVVAVGVGRDLADALHHLHARGITHGDVTPRNVLLRRDGQAVLTDFGTAMPAGGTRATPPGAVTGTPAYLAPERVSPATAAGPVEPASDVYALGLVVLEALTGRQEYEGGVTEAAVARLVREPEVPVLPDGLTPLLRRMTAARPGDRPTAGEVRAALDAIRAAWAQADGPVVPAGLPADRDVAPGPGGAVGRSSTGRRRPALLAVATATLAVAVGAGAWWTTAAPEVVPPTAAAVGVPALPAVGAPVVPSAAPDPSTVAAPPTWVTALREVGDADRAAAARRPTGGDTISPAPPSSSTPSPSSGGGSHGGSSGGFSTSAPDGHGGREDRGDPRAGDTASSSPGSERRAGAGGGRSSDAR